MQFIFINIIIILIVTRQTVNSFNFDTNKVVIHRPPYLKNTNFGYSVAGYKVDNDTWLLVGAPLTPRERPHNTLSKEGAIYRCKPNVANSCFMLPFDKRDDWHETRDSLGLYYSENKTNQFLGATLQVSNDVILACAPNYRHVSRVLMQDELRQEPTGICYTLKDKMRRIEEYSPCRNSMWGYHRQGFCQAGFSAALATNTSSLVLAGPGAWYWQGMIYSINLTNKEVKNKYPERSGEGSEDDSYRGYAVVMGYFDDDLHEDTVVSSPRGHNCRGFVEIFSSTFKLLFTLHGYQIGSYFGYDLAVLDINNDGLDDIIVGSPFYRRDRENFDIGRIDVFIRDGVNKRSIKFIQSKIDGFKQRSRFGATLAKLGDVNNDGYEDVAVAAPYDGQDSSGIVYIFHGTSHGLSHQPTQILRGSDYNLKTFGHALSGNVDIDGNKYADLIVGAYKSNAVVLLRTRPVLKLDISSHTIPKVIDLDMRTALCDKVKEKICMDFEICLRYSGKGVPSALRLKFTLELDVDKSTKENSIRAHFNSSNNSSIFVQNFTFKHDVKKCVSQIIQIGKNIRDKLTPIKSRINVSLPVYDTEGDLIPIFDPHLNPSKIHEIRFLKNCGADDVCVPNLQVVASTPSKKYIFGSRESIDINIQIFNKREDAFESQCTIILPIGVNYVKTFFTQGYSSNQLPLQCSVSKNSTYFGETKVVCDVGNPIASNTGRSFTIRVAPGNISFDQDLLTFNTSVHSSNKEDKSTLYDNEHFVYVVLDAQPSIALVGKKYQEQVIYNNKLVGEATSWNNQIKNEYDIGPEIIHEYKILNKGPSESTSSEVYITWQHQIEIDDKSHDFIYLMEKPYLEGNIRCSFDKNLINPLNTTIQPSEILMLNDTEYQESSASNQRRRRRSFSSENDYFNSNFDRYINCALVTPFYTSPYDGEFSPHESYDPMIHDVYCASIHCNIGQLTTDSFALIRLRFRLVSNNLARDSDVYTIRTHGTSVVTQIPYKKLNLDLKQFRSSTQIETIAHPKERKKTALPLDLWIIFLSAFAGAIILVLIIILLWCCGFFKRFEPKELGSSETSSNNDEASNEVVDISKQCDMGTPAYEKNSLIINYNKNTGKLTSTKSTESVYGRSNHQVSSQLIGLYSEIKKNNQALKDQEQSSLVYLTPFTGQQATNTLKSVVIKESPIATANLKTFVQQSADQSSPKKTSSPSSNMIYTNKLPPVPRRNLKTSTQATNKNLHRYPQQQKQQQQQEDGLNIKYYKEPSVSNSLERNVYGNLAKYSPQIDNSRLNNNY